MTALTTVNRVSCRPRQPDHHLGFVPVDINQHTEALGATERLRYMVNLKLPSRTKPGQRSAALM